MKLPTGMFVLVLAISGSVVSGRNYGPSKNLYNFLTLLSGFFANKDQVRIDQQGHGLDHHDNATTFWKPVYIKKLQSNITFYLEVTINKVVTMRSLWVISEDRQGIIHAQSTRVLGRETYKPSCLEDVHRQDYGDLVYEPFHDPPNCESLFYSVDADVYVGTLPDCQGVTNRNSDKIGVTLTCHSVSLNVCEAPSKLPYIEFKEDSFKLPKHITRGVHYESTCHYG